MAKYWVGGTNTWNGTAGTKWALTSGGAGGQAVPTSGDDVFFDAASGAGTVTIGSNVSTLGLDFTGFTGTLDGELKILNIFGSLTLGVGMTYSFTGTLAFRATTTSKTITTNGVSVGQVSFNGASGGWTLQDNWNGINGLSGDSTFNLEQGTLDTNGKTVFCTGFSRNFNFGAAVLTLGASTISIYDGYGWVISNSTGFTLNSGTSTIKLNSSAYGCYFIGGGEIYNNLWFTGNGQEFDIYDSNTFNDFKDDAIGTHSILFTAGITTTVTTFTVSGTAGNLITLNSSTTDTFALVKSGGGTISCDYLNIQHSVATPINTWHTRDKSVNNQAVATAGSGWIFSYTKVPKPTGLNYTKIVKPIGTSYINIPKPI